MSLRIDRDCVQQVLGCLMKHPQYFNEVDKYSFLLSDFPRKFDKYIFSAINGLYVNGAEKIQIVDIENYLKSDAIAEQTFKDENGIEYLQDIQELTEVENFPYYYNKLKKFNLLKDLYRSGFDISQFYSEDTISPEGRKVNQEFEHLTTKDITEKVRRKLLGIESKYETTDEIEVESLADGIDDLIDNLDEEQEIGMPIQGSIYNQVINGALKGTLTIRSGASGTGKTRNTVGDACYLAYGTRYNQETCEWEQVGSTEKVLLVITEQRKKEVQKMVLAYLTGINESRFRYGNFTEYERGLLKQASSIVRKYKDNFTTIKMPNPTIESIKTQIRNQCLMNNIEYVFYDYIFIGPALLNEFKGFSLRNDELLLMMATALKDLAVELNVAVFTSTQVNAKADDNTNIRNEASLAGGRSTINKADNGCIMARPTKEELEVLEQDFSGKYGTPNLVTDIYKVRSGEWTQVRIWSIVDLGTMRKKDLFITNSRLEPIEGFYDNVQYEIVDWEKSEEIISDIKKLNNGEVL